MKYKVHIATFHELVSKKTGEVYFKAPFGPVDLLLFKDTTNVMIGKDGQRSYFWNLVISQNYMASQTGRTLGRLGEPTNTEVLPE
jgi:hypothetical protein